MQPMANRVLSISGRFTTRARCVPLRVWSRSGIASLNLFANTNRIVARSNPSFTCRATRPQLSWEPRAVLGLTETPDADAADALAIGLTHLRAQEVASLGLPGATQI